MRNVYAYLCQTRKIDSQIVSDLVKEGLLYQDKMGNAVFLHKDDNGQIIGAELQGTNSYKRFKGMAAGTSDSLFAIKIGQPNRAYLFSDVSNSKQHDTMEQVKTAAARERAKERGVKTEDDVAELEKQLKRLQAEENSVKAELSDEQLKLKRVSDLITAYENIVEGNYIDNLIRAQKEREQQRAGEKRT